ncbi:MAG: glycosyltransferase family 4 protein [Verrucomicrobia bacterium]|nr:glycosyltransferase family 4 protein [Verrucomicrobiota bacterium]
MQIGIETEGLSGTIRGIGYFTLTLIEALKEENIVCYHSPNATDLHFPEVSHHHFRKRLHIPLANSLAALCHLRCYDQPHLIHFPEPKILYGKKPKAPFVLTIHDVMPLLFPHFFPKKSYLMMRYFLPRYLKEAAAVVAVSRQTRDDLVQLFPAIENKVTVIPCSLLPRQRIIDKKKEPFIFYIGSFEPRKNLTRIIEAFTILKGRGYPHRLIIAGKEEGTDCLPPKLHKDIIVTGYISEAEKDRLFQKASALVWPSLYEGFGIPLLEAMAAGTPIVTSNCSAPKEIVQDAAIGVNPLDSYDIADAIEKILCSQELSEQLMNKGLSRAADFSLGQFRERHLELYRTIFSPRR